VLEIVAGSSIGWTGPGNVMRVRRNGQRCSMVEANDTDNNTGAPVPNPALGLMYARTDLSGTYDGANHPVDINALGNIQGVLWAPRFQSPPNPILPPNTYNPEMIFDATSGSLSDAHWVPTTPISMRTWYRHEWFIEFVNVTGNRATFRVHPRIYDMAGNLIRDDATFHRQPGWGNPAQTLAQYYAGGGLFVFDDVRLSHNFGLGYEGPGGANDTGEYWYYAAVAIAVGDWVGP
jgi:hypothetical protein